MAMTDEPECHPECGVRVPESGNADGEHAHANEDGICWHEDDDGMSDEEWDFLHPDVLLEQEART